MKPEDIDAGVSHAARQLHREWESPELWSRIAAEARRPAAAAKPWRRALAAAAMVLLAVALCGPLFRHARNPALLTEEALREVQQAETAYARSIEKLSAVAAPSLDRSPAPLAAAYREKLDLLDSAIADLKQTAETNRYNAYVETQLASLYHEKQKTLEDWLQNAKQN
jgi:hypothetical protein